MRKDNGSRHNMRQILGGFLVGGAVSLYDLPSSDSLSDTFLPGGLSSVSFLLPFILFDFSWQEHWSGLPFSSSQLLAKTLTLERLREQKEKRAAKDERLDGVSTEWA